MAPVISFANSILQYPLELSTINSLSLSMAKSILLGKCTHNFFSMLKEVLEHSLCEKFVISQNHRTLLSGSVHLHFATLQTGQPLVRGVEYCLNAALIRSLTKGT